MAMKKLTKVNLALTLSLAVALTGCSQPSNSAVKPAEPAAAGTPASPATAKKDPVTLRITYWAGSQITVDKTNAVVDLFQKAYPHIKVESEYYAGDAYWDKLNVQAASSSMPDVVRMDYSKITNYVNKNLLLPLDDYMAKKTINMDGVNPIHIDGAKFNGKVYGINIGNNSLVSFYDADLLAKAGVTPPTPTYTWEQYEKDLRTIKEKLGIYGDTHMSQQHFAVWLRQHGKKMYNAAQDGIGYEDDKVFTDFFDQQLRWQKEGLISPLGVELEVRGLEDGPFPKGQAAFGSFNYWSNHVDIMETQLKKKVGMAMYPGSGDGKGMYIKPSFFHSIARTSKHPEEAALFIEFFTNNIDAAKSLNAFFGMPYHPRVLEGMNSSFSDTQKRVSEYLTTVEKNSSLIDPPDPTAGVEVGKIFKNVSDEIFFEKISPKQGAEKFRAEANAILLKKK
ncbi:ABC transporter substrate-binding protein [Paenibacillus agricola]|uniref:Extracellular solute-binding protein n=1 Tax=Paenibacillus agricola TaxID=2716264 RepID=A0ABX0JF08_9BACL|nr:extracellular solute-binding protein [Paenibacillus agricola]NHN32456.1 extracellular solute-binding protein [Paenibacillus agricola]